MKNSIVKWVALLGGALLLLTVFTACRHKDDPVNADPATPTQQVTALPDTPTPDAGTKSTPTPVPDTATPEPTATPEVTDEPLPTLMDNDPEDDDDSSSVAGSEIKPTADPDDGSVLPTPTKAPVDDIDLEAMRENDWQETFLVWLPMFTGGSYHGYAAEETFDRATFAGVTADEVNGYIAELEAAGFVQNASTDTHASHIAYSASNADNWFAEVDYGEGFLRIGSGYYPDDTGSEERLEKIWTVTALADLPRFEAGKFASDGESSDGSSYNAVFEEVTEEDVRAYTVLLAEAGYTVDPDEGDADGFIWYSAENDEGGFCDLTYYGGILKIEGGR